MLHIFQNRPPSGRLVGPVTRPKAGGLLRRERPYCHRIVGLRQVSFHRYFPCVEIHLLSHFLKALPSSTPPVVAATSAEQNQQHNDQDD